jgi:hypothetical protein
MKLTPVQREVLLALIDLYQRSKGDAIKGEGIAELINKNPGTIRNQMQSLRALGLVEGVPGPKGGYRPTTETYKILNFEQVEREVQVPIYLGNSLLDGLSVTGINLISVPDPERCRAAIHAIGNLKGLNIGDVVRIGPTPLNKLIIRGKVIGRDDIDNVLLIDIQDMLSVPKERIIEIATTDIRTISPDTAIREAAKLFVKENIRGAPVVYNHKPVGIISTVDVTRALADNKENRKVREVMSKDLHTIAEDACISHAIQMMEKYNISRLIVVDNRGDSKGIVTRTDILCRIASLCGSAASM